VNPPTERIDASDWSRLKIARSAEVPPRKLYSGERLAPDELRRVESVLQKAEAGKTAPPVSA
jgi:hypothetical protein